MAVLSWYGFGLRLSTVERKRWNRYRSRRWEILARFRRLWKQELEAPRQVALCGSVAPWLRGRVVLYGAGKVGQGIYGLLKGDGVKITGWLDKNFASLQKQGVPLTGDLTTISELEYDAVIVAIKNGGIAEQVTAELIAVGVGYERIYSLADVWENYLLV